MILVVDIILKLDIRLAMLQQTQCWIINMMEKNDIIGLKENSVDVFYMRNVIHHIPNLRSTFQTIKKYLKHNGKLIIIDCNKKCFDANVILDRIWYRYVGNNNNIFIAETYRDYMSILAELGFKQTFYKQLKEKEKSVYERN